MSETSRSVLTVPKSRSQLFLTDLCVRECLLVCLKRDKPLPVGRSGRETRNKPNILLLSKEQENYAQYNVSSAVYSADVVKHDITSRRQSELKTRCKRFIGDE